MRFRRKAGALAAIVGLLALTACQSAHTEPPAATVGASAVFPDAQVKPLVGALPQRSVSPPPATRLASGLIPPTNRWYSGLVFGAKPQPVFPLPLSFALTASGFAFGLPSVTANPTVIAGGYAPQVALDAGAGGATVTAYDDVSVTLEFHTASGARIGHTTIAEGSPLVGFTADSPVTLASSAAFAPGAGLTADRSLAVASIGGRQYAALTPTGAFTESRNRMRLARGQSIVLFPVPTGSTPDKVAQAVSGPLLSVSTGYSTGPATATTALDYRAGGGSTVFAALPTQSPLAAGTTCDLGHYESIYGTMRLCSGQRLAWSVPLAAENGALPLGRLSASDRPAVIAQLRRDAAATTPLPADSYFGGKALYRIANLLTIARAVGVADVAAALKTRLATALHAWSDPNGCATRPAQCFVYDPAMHGIVGLAASFGSDQFNDHHFHYGYFLYAAGVLAEADPSSTRVLAPVIDLLAADLATSGPSTLFPQRRTFDPYTGHSWASGFSPFADGNNQESSSEAVNAWNGLALWADASGNAALKTEARWMLSSEIASARSDWVAGDLASFTGFQHEIVSINWGGKRDYATWFSPDPNAMLGIQLIPMSPVSTYLAGDPARIKRNVTEATPHGFDVQFGDYLTMYSALAGGSELTKARAMAKTLAATAIDDADSRTYLLAWLATRG
ncbi:glycosyl hydrolase [Diaminobutyricibacter tongyongensis]|nr:glycosyl hydrolase [Diaminobutyricibacter tongyongensis]